MPRAPGAQSVMGGKMDPSTMESIKRKQMFQQQREQLAMQEKGAMGRAQLASQTQMTTAQMGVQAQQQATQAAQEGATERQAIQTEAEDRRAAEAIRDQEENRKFLEDQQAQQAEIDSKAASVDERWRLEREERKVGRAKEAQDLEFIMRRDELQYEMGSAADDTEIKWGALKYAIDSEEGRAKEALMREQMAEQYEREQGQIDVLREDVATSIQANLGLSYKSWRSLGHPRPEPEYYLDEELAKLQIKGVTMRSLSDYASLEELVGKGADEGGLGKGELMELKVLTETLEEYFSEKLKDLPEGENRLFYQDQLRTVKKADRTLHRLKRSNKKAVKDIATNAWRTVEGVSPSAIVSKFRGLDLDSFLAALKAARTDKGPMPDFKGPFADLFFEATSRRRKRFDNLFK